MKIPKAAERIKKTSNKLIRDLSLQSVNVKLRKNGIVEPNNKDLLLSTNPPALTPNNQGIDSFACPSKIVLSNLCQPFLLMKKSDKEALQSKIEDTAHLASFSNPWPKDTGLNAFSSQSQSFFPTLSIAPKAFALTMALALSLEPEALEPDSSIQYKASSQHKATKPGHLHYHKATQPISSPKHKVAGPNLSLQQKITNLDHLPQQKGTKPNQSS